LRMWVCLFGDVFVGWTWRCCAFRPVYFSSFKTPMDVIRYRDTSTYKLYVNSLPRYPDQ
jgi:hypothetical protein